MLRQVASQDQHGDRGASLPTARAHRQLGLLTAAALAASLALHTAVAVLVAGASRFAPHSEQANQEVVELAVVEPPVLPLPVATQRARPRAATDRAANGAADVRPTVRSHGSGWWNHIGPLQRSPMRRGPNL